MRAFTFCVLASAGLAAGCAGADRPSSTLDAYGAALQSGDHREAYGMMSESFRDEHSLEEFARMLEESEDEVDDAIRRLKGEHASVEVTAEVHYDLGDTLRLVREQGAWRIASNPLRFYDQSTPRRALRSFVRAYRLERWEVMLRFVPDAYREEMTAQMVEGQFRGRRAEEIAAMMDLLEANLDAPIEDRGDEARMEFGDQRAALLVREDGRWKIEEPY